MKSNIKRNIYIYCILISLLFLSICSKSSPFYPMNDWVDVNCFITVGKSILNGGVLYRDIYEQKGPILYFIYALTSAISQSSFIPVFLLEIITFSAFLYFAAKCMQLYTNSNKIIASCIALLAALVCSSSCFAHGGSVEQLCLWCITFSLYRVNVALHKKQLLSFTDATAIGLLCGLTLYIKFTMTGFFIGLAFFVLIWYILFEKAFKELSGVIVAFFLGVLLLSIPVIVYFVSHSAMEDFVTGYFANNISGYAFKNNTPVIRSFILNLAYAFARDPLLWSISAIGLLWLLTQKTSRRMSIAFLLSFTFISLTTMTGNSAYKYYALIFSGFTMFGILGISIRLSKFIVPFLPIRTNRLRFILPKFLVPCLIVILLIGTYFVSDNTYLFNYSKQDMPQYKFANYIQQYEDPSLLNYGFLDGGFYFAADIVPDCKYFAKLNASLPEMDLEQTRFIEEGLVDFVVTRGTALDAYPINSTKYKLVMQSDFFFEGQVFDYFLYQNSTL